MFDLSGAPLGLALAAGLVAAFNPCGFALLPSYLTLLIATDQGPAADRPAPTALPAVGRALRLTAAMAAGFVTVFGLFGLIVTPLALSVQQHLPWLTIVIGLVLIALGGWLLSGRELLLQLPRLRSRGLDRSLPSMYAYGLSYAIASLSCTIAPFLVLTTTTFRSDSIPAGIAVFLAYALGMVLPVGVLAVAVALAHGALVARVRRVLPYIGRISGALLVLAGAYVAYYGYYELRVFGGAAAGDPIVDTATRIQGRLAGWLDHAGAWWIGAALLVLVAIGIGTTVISRSDREPGQPLRSADGSALQPGPADPAS